MVSNASRRGAALRTVGRLGSATADVVRRYAYGVLSRQGTVSRSATRRAVNLLRRVGAPVAAAGAAAGAAHGLYNRAMTPRNLFNPSSPATPRTAARQRARGGVGIYRGRMRRARRIPRDPFVMKGFKHVTEVTGLVSDPNCVYVGHSADAAYDLIELAAQALIRKLFEKAGLTVTSVNDNLFFNSTNTCVGWRIRINRIHPQTGVITGYDYDTVATESCASICGQANASVLPNWANYMAVLTDYGTGQLGNQSVNVLEPMSLVLFADVGGSVYQQIAQLNLREEWVHFSSVSTIKVQNRSLSASGSQDAESVSANTLRMVKYKFDGVPRQRDKTAMMGLPVAKTGVLTIGAAAAASNYMREPVSPRLFWNCKGTTGGHLNPGELKSDSIKFAKKMKLLKFLRYVGYAPSDAVGGEYYTNSLKGPFTMYAFEDMINVNAAENISIAYEVNRSIGLYCTTKKVRFASGANYQLTQDSAPPV